MTYKDSAHLNKWGLHELGETNKQETLDKILIFDFELKDDVYEPREEVRFLFMLDSKKCM